MGGGRYDSRFCFSFHEAAASENMDETKDRYVLSVFDETYCNQL